MPKHKMKSNIKAFFIVSAML